MFAIASRLIDDSFATQFDISFASEVKTIAPLNLFWTEKMMEAPLWEILLKIKRVTYKAE
jgi:hypothetical protein